MTPSDTPKPCVLLWDTDNDGNFDSHETKSRKYVRNLDATSAVTVPWRH